MVRDANHAIVLDGGTVAEAGTVAELVAAGGWFARFAQAASGGDGRSVDREVAPVG